MQIRVSAQHESAMKKTINSLYAREYEKNVGRDAEFVKFLKRVHRESGSSLRPTYQGASQDLLASCAGEVRRFKGVSKDTSKDTDSEGSDGIIKRYRFDFDEGKSWADQRRAKWIVPLCIGWLDAVEQEVANISSHQDASPSLLLDTIISLLTASYHPQSRGSNATQMICTQTMHHKAFRARLKELTNIELPKPKERIARWLNNVRERGLNGEGMEVDPMSSPDADLQRQLEQRVVDLEAKLAAREEELALCEEKLRMCIDERDKYCDQLNQLQPPLPTLPRLSDNLLWPNMNNVIEPSYETTELSPSHQDLLSYNMPPDVQMSYMMPQFPQGECWYR